MCVIPHSVAMKHILLCLIAGHADAADFSVTRLIWQAAEALAWFKQTARIRKKKRVGCFASSLQINVTLKTDVGLTKKRGGNKKWRGKKRV